jgi:hypothetical protein
VVAVSAPWRRGGGRRLADTCCCVVDGRGVLAGGVAEAGEYIGCCAF